MWRPKRMKIVLILAFSTALLAQNSNTWTLTFADEFNAADLDLARWSPHDPLRKPTGPQAVQFFGGQLHLKSGSVISTFGTFAQTYGRFEIRCKVPAIRGLGPEFKLL